MYYAKSRTHFHFTTVPRYCTVFRVIFAGILFQCNKIFVKTYPVCGDVTINPLYYVTKRFFLQKNQCDKTYIQKIFVCEKKQCDDQAIVNMKLHL